MTEFNRKDYLDGKCDFKTYFAQFINQQLIDTVVYHIGGNRIMESTCPHFNDIPLSNWDNLVFVKDRIDRDKWKRLATVTYQESERGKFIWSMADQVSIAKECAAIWKNQSLQLLQKKEA